MLITMSISLAPCRMAVWVSKAFTSAAVAPSGKPITVQTFTAEPFSSWAHSSTQVGLMHTEAKPYLRAS